MNILKILKWIASLFGPDYEPYVGPQYLHLPRGELSLPIKPGANPYKLLTLLGERTVSHTLLSRQEMDQYIDYPKQEALDMNTYIIGVRLHTRRAGDLEYQINNGRQLVIRPVVGWGYEITFVVTDSAEHPGNQAFMLPDKFLTELTT